MTKPTSPQRKYLFMCGCLRKFRTPFPRPLDEVSCIHHGPTRIVSDDAGWVVKCYDCKFMSRFNELKYNACRSYMQHIIKYPSHTTEVSHGDQIYCNNVVTSPLYQLDLSKAG